MLKLSFSFISVTKKIDCNSDLDNIVNVLPDQLHRFFYKSMLILNMMPAACHKQVWIGATKTGKVVKSKNTFETFETGKHVHW